MTEEENLNSEEPTIEAIEPTEIKSENEEYKDKYLRLLAEMENTRKRLQKEKLDMTRFAVENVLIELLPPIDNLENALKFTDGLSQETLHWVKGFEMILHQFKDVLTQNGVASFDSLSNFFDANLHEAVEVEESDKKEGTILQEYVKGYKSAQRTLRPARVKVAQKKSLEKPINEE